MGTRKVNVRDYLGYSFSELCDYRTHTVPVKKSEPRMFMGKEVPEGATHYLMNEDDEYVWLAYPDRGSHNPAFYQSGSWYTLPLDAVVRGPIHKLPKEEKIMKKGFTKEDLRSGMRVTLRDGAKMNVMLSVYQPLDKDILVSVNGQGWLKLENYGSDLVHSLYSDYDIMEIWYPYDQAYWSTDDSRFTLIWKREEKTPEQLAYEALQAQIAEEEARHADSIKALREQAEKLKPKVSL